MAMPSGGNPGSPGLGTLWGGRTPSAISSRTSASNCGSAMAKAPSWCYMAGMIRKYSIEELNQMRRAILRMLPFDVSDDDAQTGLLVEARLQTYIMTGISPEDLDAIAENWPRSDGTYGGILTSDQT